MIFRRKQEVSEPVEGEEILPLATDAPDYDPPARPWTRYVMTAAIVAYVVLVVAAVASGSFNLLDPVVQIPVLAAITMPLARRVARSERDPNMYQFVMAAFAAKILGALVRNLVTQALYGGVSDSSEYHLYGKFLAPYYRRLDFSPDVGKFSGTGFLRSLTGAVYSVAGSSKLGGYVIFAWLSFIGLLLLWRAFCRAVPDGLHYRYGLLVLFLPSLLYWPSALGKDAWAVFGLGLASYGVARMLTRDIPVGLLLFIAGVASVTFLRPHVALTMFCGVVLAAAVAKPRERSGKAPVVRLVVFGALAVMGSVLVGQTSSFFGVERLDQETINQTLANAEGRTDEGGSNFAPVTMTNPANAPLAIITVLFRPLPIEAHNVQSLVTSFESVFIVVLTIKSRKRLRSLWRQMREAPYVAYSLGITFTFIYAFSSFSNFGILARQRTQVMPFYLVLICLPEWQRRRQGEAPTLESLDEKPPDVYPTVEVPDPYTADREAKATIHDPYARFPELGSGPPRGG